MSQHALLSASSAQRWLACPPSARLAQLFPQSTTAFADEGTQAHQYAQAVLKVSLESAGVPVSTSDDVPCPDAMNVSAEMADYIQEYTDFVMGCVFESTGLYGAWLEQPVSFEDYVPGGWGTADVILLSDHEITVIDLKYGQGLPVRAAGNPQVRLYALGALTGSGAEPGEMRTIRTWIAQPRLRNYSEAVTTPSELLEWADDTVRPAAIMAYQGAGDFMAGEHCRFCPARGACLCEARSAVETCAMIPEDPALLTDRQLAAVLPAAGILRKAATDIEEEALRRMQDGVDLPGWEIRQSSPRRRIEDVEGAVKALADEGVSQQECMKPPELRSQTDLKKLLGPAAFNRILGPFLVSPSGGGKPSVAMRRDAVPPVDPLGSAAFALTFPWND